MLYGPRLTMCSLRELDARVCRCVATGNSTVCTGYASSIVAHTDRESRYRDDVQYHSSTSSVQKRRPREGRQVSITPVSVYGEAACQPCVRLRVYLYATVKL